MNPVLLVPDLPGERWHSMDRYADRLAHHLAGLDTNPLRIEAPVPVDSITGRTSAPGNAVGRTRPATGAIQRMWRRYYSYPDRVAGTPAELYHILDHSYGHIVDRLAGEKTIATVHDLSPVHALAEGGFSLRRRVRNRYLKRVLAGLRNASGWIVGTEWMRTALAEWLGHDNTIFVVPFGIDDEYFDDDQGAARRTRFGIADDALLLLHVGSSDARKNLPCLMETVRELKQEREVTLLQIGGDPDAVIALAKASGVASSVVAAGNIPETELRSAYRTADVFVFPSTYEGFGFPILEAMASGLPVVTSGAGGSREVVADAGIVVPEPRPDAYAAAIARLVCDPDLRESYIDAGRKRARRFSWSDCAKGTLAAYRTVLGLDP